VVKSTKTKNWFHWNIPVERSFDKAVEAALELNWSCTKAEFVRSAVREKLLELGINPQRPERWEAHVLPDEGIMKKARASRSFDEEAI
jgi:hypothetical protein